MVEENRSGFGKIIGMELVYMLLVMVLAALACFVQFLGNEYSHQTSSFIFSGDVYSYNVIMYLIGAIFFVVGAYILYRVIFSKYVDELAGFNVGYSIIVWILSLVMAVVMWWGLIVEYFLYCGFGSMDPESLIWVTVIGWPVYTTGLVGIMLILCRRKSDGKD